MAKRYTDAFRRDAVHMATASGLMRPHLSSDLGRGLSTLNKWDARRQAEGAIFQYINGFYNPRRRHSSLGGKSPLAFKRKAA